MIFYKLQELILKSPAKRDRLILANLFLAIAIDMAIWLLLIFNFWRSSEYIVLGYNIYFGISSFGHWYQVLLLPILGLIIIIFNFTLAFNLYLKEKILSYFLALGSLIFNILILITSLIIIYVNI